MTLDRKTIQRLSIGLFIALILWGGYSTLVYFGSELRMIILLVSGESDRISALCGDVGEICQGIVAIVPTIFHTLVRAAPFFGYAIVSAVFYGIFLFVYGVRNGRVGQVRFRFRPWHILLLFLGAVWLHFVTLSYLNTDDWSLRQIVEPKPGVYQNIGESAFQALQDNFQRLKDAGCLSLVRQLREDVGEYSMNGTCMQGFFISRVLTQALFLLFIVTVLLSVGRAALVRLPIRKQPLFFEFVFSAALGVCITIVGLWVLALIGIFNMYVGWGFLLVVLAVTHKHLMYWLQQLHNHQWETEEKWWSPRLLLIWFLLSYLALNFLAVIRPFPIGWDDLGSYLNQPRLLVSYGQFISSLSSFKWEYMTALGYLLWGYDSTFGITAAMQINWLEGVFAILVIIAFTRRHLGATAGVLAATIYYTLPLVGHFSYADMKIDNAVFAMTSLSLLCGFIGVFRTEEEQDQPAWPWFVLAGLFCGFAFSFKQTAMIAFMALGVVMTGALWHFAAFFGMVALSLFAYVKFWSGFNLAGIAERVGMPLPEIVLVIATLLVAAGCFWWAYIKAGRARTMHAIRMGLFTFLGFAIALGPWLINNNIREGNIIPHLALGAPNNLTPTLDINGRWEGLKAPTPVRALPLDLRVDTSNPACASTSRVEELDRYWGSYQGWTHYLTLPWRTVMNRDSTGYYVTTAPMLLLFPLLLILPFFWMKSGRWLRWLFAATVFMVLQWVFLGNGVPWYGLSGFIGLVIGLEVLVAKAPDFLNRTAATVLIVLSLISNFGMRLWQFEMQQSILEYPIGKASAEVMQERTIPHYDDIADIVVERNQTLTDRPYLYRIGTFIPFFIPRNLEIMALQDQQLDMFRCMNQEGDNHLTYRRLLALGINSIVFDTNTATIETDQSGTLHQKVNQFLAFLNDQSLPIEVFVYDPDAGIAFVLLNDLVEAVPE